MNSHKQEIAFTKVVWITWLVVAIVGFADAAYLTASHYSDKAVECSLVHGCDVVLTSSYATIGLIPVALLGAMYYAVLLLGMVAYLDTRSALLFGWLPRLTVCGLLSSLWFVYLQVFVLHAYCQYCLLSAVTSTILFVLGVYTIVRRKKI